MTATTNGSGFRPRLATTQRLTVRGVAVLAGAVGIATLMGIAGGEPSTSRSVYVGMLDLRGISPVELELDSTRLKLVAAQGELERARRLIDYSAQYNIPADLAATIYDIARDERLDPELAFRLVWQESRFVSRAVSAAGALGLAQVQPATARFYVSDITPERLFDRDVNLRIGFRYLQDLRRQFGGDLPLALIAYNRGPARLRTLLAGGLSPWNGYASAILNGYEESAGILQ